MNVHSVKSIGRKKGIIAVLLMFAVLFAGVYSYYYQIKEYKINPLIVGQTTFIIPKTTGATRAQNVRILPHRIIIPWTPEDPEMGVEPALILPPEMYDMGGELQPVVLKKEEQTPTEQEVIAELREEGLKADVVQVLNPAGEVIAPEYANEINADKKIRLNFQYVGDMTELIHHFEWLIEKEHIYEAGPDGILGTSDDVLVGVVVLHLVKYSQIPGNIYGFIILPPGRYGIIKCVCYWTKAVTTEVSGAIKIAIWADEVP